MCNPASDIIAAHRKGDSNFDVITSLMAIADLHRLLAQALSKNSEEYRGQVLEAIWKSAVENAPVPAHLQSFLSADHVHGLGVCDSEGMLQFSGRVICCVIEQHEVAGVESFSLCDREKIYAILVMANQIASSFDVLWREPGL